MQIYYLQSRYAQVKRYFTHPNETHQVKIMLCFLYQMEVPRKYFLAPVPPGGVLQHFFSIWRNWKAKCFHSFQRNSRSATPTAPATSHSGNHTAHGVKQKVSQRYGLSSMAVSLNHLKGNSQTTINSKPVFVIKYKCFYFQVIVSCTSFGAFMFKETNASMPETTHTASTTCMRHWETDKVWCKSLHTSQPWKLSENHFKNSVVE